jgi:cation transport regulator ChaC
LNISNASSLTLNSQEFINCPSKGIVDDRYHLPSKVSQKTQEEAPLKKYLNMDPYDLEEKHQEFFKDNDLRESAICLIASAVAGMSDNLDYLLKLEPEARSFISKNNKEEIEKIIDLVIKDLKS